MTLKNEWKGFYALLVGTHTIVVVHPFVPVHRDGIHDVVRQSGFVLEVNLDVVLVAEPSVVLDKDWLGVNDKRNAVLLGFTNMLFASLGDVQDLQMLDDIDGHFLEEATDDEAREVNNIDFRSLLEYGLVRGVLCNDVVH